MSRWNKLIASMRASQNNVGYKDLCALVEHMGFVGRRQEGSHVIYRHGTRKDLPLVNLQEAGGKAKPYQVRQVLKLIDEHGLEEET